MKITDEILEDLVNAAMSSCEHENNGDEEWAIYSKSQLRKRFSKILRFRKPEPDFGRCEGFED